MNGVLVPMKGVVESAGDFIVLNSVREQAWAVSLKSLPADGFQAW